MNVTFGISHGGIHMSSDACFKCRRLPSICIFRLPSSIITVEVAGIRPLVINGYYEFDDITPLAVVFDATVGHQCVDCRLQ